MSAKTRIQIRELSVDLQALSNRIVRMQFNVNRRFDRIMDMNRLIMNQIISSDDQGEETANPEPHPEPEQEQCSREELEQLRRERDQLALELRDEQDPQYLTAGKLIRARSKA